LRLMECCRLRVKDIDFSRNQIVVRAGKGDKDRQTMLPAAVKEIVIGVSWPDESDEETSGSENPKKRKDPRQIEFKWGDVQYDDLSTMSLHALHRGKIVGFIDIYPLPTGEYGIGQITVQPAFQRQGIATKLFHMAKAKLPNLVAHSYDYTEAGIAWVESLDENPDVRATPSAEETKVATLRFHGIEPSRITADEAKPFLEALNTLVEEFPEEVLAVELTGSLAARGVSLHDIDLRVVLDGNMLQELPAIHIFSAVKKRLRKLKCKFLSADGERDLFKCDVHGRPVAVDVFYDLRFEENPKLRITREDAAHVLKSLDPLVGQRGITSVYVVGSVATQGESSHDLDIAMEVDIMQLDIDPEERRELEEKGESFMASESPDVVGLVNAVHAAMKKAGCTYEGSIDESDQFECKVGGRKLPVEIFYLTTGSTPNPPVESIDENPTEGRRASNLIRLPRAFYDDHRDRGGLPTPEAVRESPRFVWVRRDDPDLPELVSDAEYYAWKGWRGEDYEEMAKWGRKAKALLRALKAAGEFTVRENSSEPEKDNPRRILNFGSGYDYQPDAINIDCREDAWADVYTDFCGDSLPFDDETFDEVRAFGIPGVQLTGSWPEIVRVLKPTGRIRIQYVETLEEDAKNLQDFGFMTLPEYINRMAHFDNMRIVERSRRRLPKRRYQTRYQHLRPYMVEYVVERVKTEATSNPKMSVLNFGSGDDYQPDAINVDWGRC